MVDCKKVILSALIILTAGLGCNKHAPTDSISPRENLPPTITHMNVFSANDDVRNIAVDQEDNLYALSGSNVFKVTPGGDKSIFGTYHGFLGFASDMQIGPGGALYLLGRFQDLYRITTGGGDAEPYIRFPSSVNCFDFDRYGNLYAWSFSGGLFTYNTNQGIVETHRFMNSSISCIRVYDDYVYAAGFVHGTGANAPSAAIWRSRILSPDGSLGEEEIVFYWGFAGEFSESSIYSMTFSETGDLYVSTDHADPVVVIRETDNQYLKENVYSLCGGTINSAQGTPQNPSPPQNRIVWGNGKSLYILRSSSIKDVRGLYQVQLETTGAPYFGRQLPDYPSEGNSPAIFQVIPSECLPGALTITLQGQNFSPLIGENAVYFDEHGAEITHASSTEITVRRPDITGESVQITLEIIRKGRVFIARYGPYRIDPVMIRYGGFFSGLQLTALTIDQNENLYVFQQDRTVYRVSPGGTATAIGNTTRLVTDSKIGPGGTLILFMNNRSVRQMDPATGEESEWTTLSRRVSCGDFDANGNLYAGGRQSDLIAVNPDLTSRPAGAYSSDEILCVRVFNGRVYVLADRADVSGKGVWRHEILDVHGNLGAGEMALDWAQTGEFADSNPTCFDFSADGTLFVGSDHDQPILILRSEGTQDILYKNIIPNAATKLAWGGGNYLYMILDGSERNILRIDMGMPGAPYYGR